MVQLLAVEKVELARSGFLDEAHDDPLLACRAERLDRRRGELANAVDAARLALRDDEECENGTHRRALVLRAATLESARTEADTRFAALLTYLPRMTAFEGAWERSWAVMVAERGWPHKTAERRAWREAMRATKPEVRACFLGQPTAF